MDGYGGGGIEQQHKGHLSVGSPCLLGRYVYLGRYVCLGRCILNHCAARRQGGLQRAVFTHARKRAGELFSFSIYLT